MILSDRLTRDEVREAFNRELTYANVTAIDIRAPALAAADLKTCLQPIHSLSHRMKALRNGCTLLSSAQPAMPMNPSRA